MPKITCTPTTPTRVRFREIPEGVAFIDHDDDICFKLPYSAEDERYTVVYVSKNSGICAVPPSWYDDYEDFTFPLYTGTVTLTW